MRVTRHEFLLTLFGTATVLVGVKPKQLSARIWMDKAGFFIDGPDARKVGQRLIDDWEQQDAIFNHLRAHGGTYEIWK